MKHNSAHSSRRPIVGKQLVNYWWWVKQIAKIYNMLKVIESMIEFLDMIKPMHIKQYLKLIHYKNDSCYTTRNLVCTQFIRTKIFKGFLHIVMQVAI